MFRSDASDAEDGVHSVDCMCSSRATEYDGAETRSKARYKYVWIANIGVVVVDRVVAGLTTAGGEAAAAAQGRCKATFERKGDGLLSETILVLDRWCWLALTFWTALNHAVAR